MAIPKRYENIDFRPTEAMARNAERGLDSRREFGRGGTSVGVARARDIKNRVNLSPETVRRMFSYFSRHEVDKQAEGFSRGEDGYPSAGRIAWDLWGGDEGFTWSRERARQMKTADANVKEWVVNQDRDLPVIVRDEWDGDQARRNLLEFARDEDGVINPTIARRGFLAYDDEAEQVQASYLFPIADVIEEGMVVVSSALSAALSRLPQTNKLTAEQIADARMVVEEYQSLLEGDDEMENSRSMPTFDEVSKSVSEAIVRTYNGIAGALGVNITPKQIEEIQTKLVKSLGDGKVGGNLVLFTNPSSPDLTNEYFDKDTNYGVNDGDVIFIDIAHSQDFAVKNIPIGHAVVKIKDDGIEVDGQLWIDSFDGDEFIKRMLGQREEYEELLKRYGYKALRRFISGVAGYADKWVNEYPEKVGWSSEVDEHPIKDFNNGVARIGEWIISKATLTPRPAEYRNVAFAKSIDLAIAQLSKESNSMTEETEVLEADGNLPAVDENLEVEESGLTEDENAIVETFAEQAARIEGLEGKVDELTKSVNDLLAQLGAKSLRAGQPRNSPRTMKDHLRAIQSQVPQSAKSLGDSNVGNFNPKAHDATPAKTIADLRKGKAAVRISELTRTKSVCDEAGLGNVNARIARMNKNRGNM